MRLHELNEGQRFVLTRTGKKFKHHGRHPAKRYLVLTAPYSPIPIECKTLHIACEVKPVIDSAILSDNPVVTRKPGCFNRSRSALSSPYIVPAGFKEDGSKRFMTIRTAWNNAASGACNYASTDEGKADSDCVGCLWRAGE